MPIRRHRRTDLVSLAEGNLNDAAELGELFRSVGLCSERSWRTQPSAFGLERHNRQPRPLSENERVAQVGTCTTHLNVGDAFKVSNQVLDEALPRVEPLNQNVGRAQFVTVSRTRRGSTRTELAR